MHKHHISVLHALDGLFTAIRTQPNFRVHLFLSLLSLVLGWCLRVSTIEWIVLVFTIFVGLVIELLNTAIEFTVDLITQERRLLAKYAKDTAAAAMLVYAVAAAGIGLLIFVPRILVWLSI